MAGAGPVSRREHGVGRVALRPATRHDERFEFELFASGHAPAQLRDAIGEAAAAPLVEAQYRAREAGWTQRWPAAERAIVVADGDDVGRALSASTAGEILLIDLAVEPHRRGCGVGSAVLGLFTARSVAAGVPLRLSVLVTNIDAQRLYRRAGFVETGRNATHAELEWRPNDR